MSRRIRRMENRERRKEKGERSSKSRNPENVCVYDRKKMSEPLGLAYNTRHIKAVEDSAPQLKDHIVFFLRMEKIT